jgi:hypothetical protein
MVTSRSESTLADYLRLEDDLKFVEAFCPSTGILAWPAIRQDVLRTLIGDRIYSTSTPAGIGPRRSIPRTISGALGATIWNATHPPPSADVLLLATGAGLIRVDGRWRNRIVDDFAGILGPRGWTLEASFPGLQSMRARVNRRVGSLIADRARIALVSRIQPRRAQRQVMAELLEVVDVRARDLLGWEIGDRRKASLIERGASRLAAYPIKARLYTQLLRRIKPRLALVEEGCYGHMAVFNAVAREHGVRVAEFQHGMVTQGHDAYNVASILAESEAYRRTQPHTFLGYGDWWLDQISAPVDERLAIGNPYRSIVLRHWAPCPERRNILVLGDGVETDAHLAFAASVARLAPGSSSVVFRPHPLEAHRVRRRGLGVELDRESDLYTSLANARAVVAESSTVLFEAAGLVPRVFAWDTPKSRFHLGPHPFEKTLDPSDLVARLAEPRPSDVPSGASLWADDWESRFREFLGQVLRGRAAPGSAERQ